MSDNESDPIARAGVLNELFKRLFTSAPMALREDDGPFNRRLSEWVAWYRRTLSLASEQLPAIGPWIAAYNDARDEVIAAGGTPPRKARSVLDRILDIPRDITDAASSGAWGVGGIVLILGGLYLWSTSRSRRG